MSREIRRWSFRMTALFMPLLIMGCHDDRRSSTRDILDIIDAVGSAIVSIIRVAS